MIKLLGGLDIFVGIIFLVYGLLAMIGLNLIPGVFVSTLGVIILAKGLIFSLSLDIVSFLDVASGFIIIFSSTTKFPFFLIAIVSVFLIQKGFFSLQAD